MIREIVGAVAVAGLGFLVGSAFVGMVIRVKMWRRGHER